MRLRFSLQRPGDQSACNCPVTVQKHREAAKESVKHASGCYLVLSNLFLGTLENSPWNTSLCICICTVHSYTCSHVHAFSSLIIQSCTQQYCHAAYALSLHFLPISGLFQGTNPASFLSQSSVLTNALCAHLGVQFLTSGQWETAFSTAYCWLFIFLMKFLDALGPPGWHSLHCLRGDLNESKMYLPFTASNPLNSCLLNGISWECTWDACCQLLPTLRQGPPSSSTTAGWARAGERAQHREA